MQIGFKINEKCYFSVISWPILILFVLSDRAWLRAFKTSSTEFGSSLIMQIYANLFKINEKCYFYCHFLADFDSVSGLSDQGLVRASKLLHRNFEIH